MESFNGKLRDEFVNERWVLIVVDAQLNQLLMGAPP